MTTFIIMMIVIIALLVIRNGKQAELDQIVEYNEQPMRQMELARYDEIVYRNAFLVAQFGAIDGLEENIETYPVGNSVVRQVFYDCSNDIATLTFGDFSASEGKMSLVARAEVVEDINKFIKKLTEQDVFTDVNYTGYTYQEETGLWNIKVECTLAESAGRED